MSELRPRVIPCLQIDRRALVKTRAFRDPVYLGDPVNAARIFNDLEADEMILVDIGATRAGLAPDIEFLEEFASECFMPLAYGGAVSCIEQIRRLFDLGIEKVVLNSAENLPSLVRSAAGTFGSQSIVVAIDVRRSLLGRHEVYTHSASRRTRVAPTEYAAAMQAAGAGELFLQSVEREGSGVGYDVELVRSVCSEVDIPVIACGGAGGIEHMRSLLSDSGVTAVAAGTMFVLHGKHRAPLISFPTPAQIEGLRP